MGNLFLTFWRGSSDITMKIDLDLGLSKHLVINAACRECLWKKIFRTFTAIVSFTEDSWSELQQSFLFNYSIDDAVPWSNPNQFSPTWGTPSTNRPNYGRTLLRARYRKRSNIYRSNNITMRGVVEIASAPTCSSDDQYHKGIKGGGR